MSATLVHCRDPFRPDVNRSVRRVRHGTRIDTVLRAHGLITGRGKSSRRNSTFVVSVGSGSDCFVTEDDWCRKLAPNDIMTVLAVPKGGGALRTIALIAVAVVAAWVTGGGAAVAGTGWFAAGSASAFIAGAAVTIAGPMIGEAVHP